ncbi:phage major capsid protein [Alloscardovia criceti]|uniref:phage major capsid protein n=1 Tax=Alloscardovia criceti TaxID=356828 RepID=UPI00036C3D6E|nr:phage major capsid protein [Alloscardovia criceti]
MALTTLINNEAAFPNRTGVDAGEAIPGALIMNASTIMGEVEGDAATVRIAYVSVDPEAEITAEGAEIEAKDPTISELIVGTQKVASLSVISNEAYSHNSMPELIGGSLARSIVAKADRLFLGAPAGEVGQANKIVGLANYQGIVDGGNLGTSLDAIIDAMAAIATNGGTPMAILLGFDAWAYMLKLKGADKRPLISPDVANSAEPTLFGLPVVLSAYMPANTIIIIDKDEIVSSVGTVIASTTEDRYFEHDSVGLRATFRFGYGILHPNRIAKISAVA